MSEQKRPKTKVNPLTDGEDEQPAKPLETVPEGKPGNATNAIIPGTGQVVRDITGKEAKRVLDT